jgi:hypothetical protein
MRQLPFFFSFHLNIYTRIYQNNLKTVLRKFENFLNFLRKKIKFPSIYQFFRYPMINFIVIQTDFHEKILFSNMRKAYDFMQIPIKKPCYDHKK